MDAGQRLAQIGTERGKIPTDGDIGPADQHIIPARTPRLRHHRPRHGPQTPLGPVPGDGIAQLFRAGIADAQRPFIAAVTCLQQKSRRRLTPCGCRAQEIRPLAQDGRGTTARRVITALRVRPGAQWQRPRPRFRIILIITRSRLCHHDIIALRIGLLLAAGGNGIGHPCPAFMSPRSGSGATIHHADSRLRPLARRAARTRRPPTVAMRARKP